MISGYKLYEKGVETKVQLAVANQDLQKVNEDISAAEKALSIFSSMEKHGGSAENLNEGLAKLILQLNLHSLQNGINISSLALAGNVDNQPVASISESVPMGGGLLMQTPMTIRLGYQDYAGLKRFLGGLTDLNVAVSKLDITGMGVVIEAKYLSAG